MCRVGANPVGNGQRYSFSAIRPIDPFRRILYPAVVRPVYEPLPLVNPILRWIGIDDHVLFTSIEYLARIGSRRHRVRSTEGNRSDRGVKIAKVDQRIA